MNIDEVLCHHGVKGMKWGVRKKPVSSGTGRKKSSKKNKLSSLLAKHKKKRLAKARAKNATKKRIAESKKTVKQMTDAELDRNIQRLRKEKEYKELNNSVQSAGKSFIKDVIKTSGKAVAIEVSKNVMAYVINEATGQKMAKTTMLNPEEKKKKKAAEEKKAA